MRPSRAFRFGKACRNRSIPPSASPRKTASGAAFRNHYAQNLERQWFRCQNLENKDFMSGVVALGATAIALARFCFFADEVKVGCHMVCVGRSSVVGRASRKGSASRISIFKVRSSRQGYSYSKTKRRSALTRRSGLLRLPLVWRYRTSSF